MLKITFIYSCQALVISDRLLCLSSIIKMIEFVDIIATEDGRIHGSKRQVDSLETFDDQPYYPFQIHLETISYSKQK